MEANDFGNLLHNTLAALSGSPVANETDENIVRDWLHAKLTEIANETYGKQPSAIIRIQLEQARQRLSTYAALHVDHVKEGWTIWKTEVSIDTDAGVCITVDGIDMPIIGRIDRIDYHAESNRYAIWDYKTGDATKDRCLRIGPRPWDGSSCSCLSTNGWLLPWESKMSRPSDISFSLGLQVTRNSRPLKSQMNCTYPRLIPPRKSFDRFARSFSGHRDMTM